MVNCILTIPQCRSGHYGTRTGSNWALKSCSPSRAISQSSRNFALLVAPCPCSCFARCCHDPFTVRSTQPCPPFLGFTQLVHPSRYSRSTLTTVCFCLCFCFCSRVSESAASAPDPSSARQHHLVVKCEIPWSVEYQSCNLQCCCSTDAEIGFVPTIAPFFSFLILKSSSRTFSCPKVSLILVIPVLLSIDTSKNSPFLQHSMLSRSELTLQITKCGSQSVQPNLVVHASMEKLRIYKARSFARPAVSLFQQNPICLGSSMKVSYKQMCILLRHRGLRLPSNTGVSCSFCHGVHTVSVFDEWFKFQIRFNLQVLSSSIHSNSTTQNCSSLNL